MRDWTFFKTLSIRSIPSSSRTFLMTAGPVGDSITLEVPLDFGISKTSYRSWGESRNTASNHLRSAERSSTAWGSRDMFGFSHGREYEAAFRINKRISAPVRYVSFRTIRSEVFDKRFKSRKITRLSGNYTKNIYKSSILYINTLTIVATRPLTILCRVRGF